MAPLELVDFRSPSQNMRRDSSLLQEEVIGAIMEKVVAPV